jgi:hypothetical protein
MRRGGEPVACCGDPPACSGRSASDALEKRLKHAIGIDAGQRGGGSWYPAAVSRALNMALRIVAAASSHHETRIGFVISLRLGRT